MRFSTFLSLLTLLIGIAAMRNSIRAFVNRDAFYISLFSATFPVVSGPFLHAKSMIFRSIPSLGDAEARLWKHVAVLMRPELSFDEISHPPAPDYSNEECWFALPSIYDGSDLIPPGVPVDNDTVADADKADAFYLHPTMYYMSENWNANYNDTMTGYIVQDGLLVQQASAFNAVANIYAPKYRQMAGAGYYDPVNGPKALALAYSDVRAAFQYFIDHFHKNNTPIFLVGHSQGSQHIATLVEEFFEPNEHLRQSLVAAYMVGTQIFDGKFRRKESTLHICQNKDDINCVISWRTYSHDGGNPQAFLWNQPPDGESSVCTNPLTWRSGDEADRASADLHEGIVHIVHPLLNLFYVLGRPFPERVHEGMSPVERTPAVSGAQCIDGHLFVDRPAVFGEFTSSRVLNLFPVFEYAKFPGDNYHAYDWNLFYLNARSNAKNRMKNFVNARRK